jgi:phosphoserine phosphatase
MDMNTRLHKEDIKLICFDLNKTLIKDNTWYNLNIAMGMTEEEDQSIMSFAEKGFITYEQAQQIIEEIYKRNGKATHENIMQVVLEYTYTAGAEETVKYLKEKGYEIALISGSMNLVVEHIAAELDIALHGANNIFSFNKDNYLENIAVVGEDEIVKLDLLRTFARKLKINLDQCACVGDGDNDSIMFRETGRGITFTGSKIERLAWKTIDSLTDLKTVF